MNNDNILISAMLLSLSAALPSFAQQPAADSICTIVLSNSGDSISIPFGEKGYLKAEGNEYTLFTECQYTKIIKDTTKQTNIKVIEGGACYSTDNGIPILKTPKRSLPVPELNNTINNRLISFASDTTESAQFDLGNGALRLKLERYEMPVEMTMAISILNDSGGSADSTFTIKLDDPKVKLIMADKDTIKSIKLISPNYFLLNGMTFCGKEVENPGIRGQLSKEQSVPVDFHFVKDEKNDSLNLSINVSLLWQNCQPFEIQVDKQEVHGTIIKAGKGFWEKLLLLVGLLLAAYIVYIHIIIFKKNKKDRQREHNIQEFSQMKQDYEEYSRMLGCLTEIENILELDNINSMDNSEKWNELAFAVRKLKESCMQKVEQIESLKTKLADAQAENDKIKAQQEEQLSRLRTEFEKEKEYLEERMERLVNEQNDIVNAIKQQNAEYIDTIEKRHVDEIEKLKQDHVNDMMDKDMKLDILNTETAFGKKLFHETVSPLIREISSLAAAINRQAVNGTFLSDHASRIVSSSNSLSVLEQKISEQTEITDLSLSSFINEVSTEIDSALNDSRSWINEAIRLYAYNAVPAISDVLKTLGLSKDNINCLVYKSSDLLLAFGYHLDEIPSLFKTLGDNSIYNKESMDTFIQDIYPEFREILADNVVFDFFKIGYKKDSSTTKTTVTF